MPWTCEHCGGWKNIDQGNHANDEPCSCLTFAEAMAKDPRKVEVRWAVDSDDWYRMDEAGVDHAMLKRLRGAYYRGARPKRSRVQEMADNLKHLTPGEQSFYCQGGLDAVRAVCGWLRDRMFDGNDDADGNDIAIALEREFLRPR